MTMMDIHREALDSTAPAFHQFLGVYKNNIKCIYGFVEGKEDPSFYGNILDQNTPKSVEFEIIQQVKKTLVIKLYEEFDWGRFFKKTNVVFY